MRVDTRLKEQRPDMLCLFALPVGADETLSVPALMKRIVSYLSGGVEPAPDLPRVQAFAPLLLDSSGATGSPSGLIAGVLSASAQASGCGARRDARCLGGTPRGGSQQCARPVAKAASQRASPGDRDR
jgi:hypothetical protein